MKVCFVFGQTKQFDLLQAGCQLYNGNIYSFGISERKQKPAFYVYKMDLRLKALDSMVVEPGKNTAGSYLQTYSDTLHDYLNIYFQKKDQKTVSILRFNKKYELIAVLDNIDVARLNNTSLFSDEAYYFKNNVYSIKTVSDTSGKQFYLNKHTLKSEKENFDYEFKWQFPFERKNIQSAHVFYADKNYIFLFVTVAGDLKKGQWILKLNSGSGNLEKAGKLNDKGETDSYMFGASFIDRNYKSISLTGQKFTEGQFNPSALTIANAPSLNMYYIEIDSLGEITTKQDFKIPINDVKSGVKKTSNGYLLRSYDLLKKPGGNISFSGDVFRSSNSALCYQYVNTGNFNLVRGEEKLVPEKSSISPNLMIEDYYSGTDKLDMNGRLCIDSLNQFEKIFYQPLTFPVKLKFKTDDEKNPLWILSKHTFKKNGINFSFLSPVKKIYQVSLIEEISETLNPSFMSLGNGSFLISSQTGEGKYQLKLYNW